MAELEKKYYSVKCKCGHVGAYRFYIPIEFGVIATSKKEAAEKEETAAEAPAEEPKADAE